VDECGCDLVGCGEWELWFCADREEQHSGEFCEQGRGSQCAAIGDSDGRRQCHCNEHTDPGFYCHSHIDEPCWTFAYSFSYSRCQSNQYSNTRTYFNTYTNQLTDRGFSDFYLNPRNRSNQHAYPVINFYPI
jgi:hypothetical protein